MSRGAAGPRGRAARPLSPDARSLVQLLESDTRKAKSPAGAFVLLAARLNSPAKETAQAVGIPVRDLQALVTQRGRIVTLETLRRLGAYVSLLWARLASAARDRAELAVAALDVPDEPRVTASGAHRTSVQGAPHETPAPLNERTGRAGMPPRKLPPNSGNGDPC